MFIGLVALAGLVSIFWLALEGVGIPEPINSITSAAVGALGAVLARTGFDSSPDGNGGATG